MSNRKFQYVDDNQDPELTARIRSVMFRAIHQTLDTIETLLEEPIHTPYRVDPKSANAGEKSLRETAAMESALSARTRRLADHTRFIEAARTLIITKQSRAEENAATAQHKDDVERTRELVDAARGNLDAEQLKALRTEYGDGLNIPSPPASDPQSGRAKRRRSPSRRP